RGSQAGTTRVRAWARRVLTWAVRGRSGQGAALAGAATVLTGCASPEESGGDAEILPAAALGGPALLGEPYLLDPSRQGVRVVWHTDSASSLQVVLVGESVASMTEAQALEVATRDTGNGRSSTGRGRCRRFKAVSRRLSQLREDSASKVPDRSYTAVESREIWQHMAEVRPISGGRRPYRVVSVDAAGTATVSKVYTLRPALAAKDHARLLLTSDHQLKPMTAANLELVSQTIGVELDGVLMAGDLVNVPDRASEWFDSTAAPAFFAAMTGRAAQDIGGRTYHGAPVLQHTPIFPAIGNHEVMGRWSTTSLLKSQFEDPQPLDVATRRWEQTQPSGVERDTWITQHSWNTTSYEELFPYPRSDEGGARWYSRTIGEVFLVSLFAAGIWRSPTVTGRGRFQEAADSLENEDTWGYGDFLFEPIKRGSRQYAWLERTLSSKEARRARYRVVMFHRPSHGLGWNSSPPFTDPVQAKSLDPVTGKLTSVTYSYPLADDQILRDVEPLLNRANVHLVLNGHSHIWNRFRNAAGVHWLETSNVNGTLGVFDALSGAVRPGPTSADLVGQGDPGGLTPIVPTVKPLTGTSGTPLPYLASNDITAFSILDSGAGTVRSYMFDTRTPQAAAELFDEFALR
ncbi:MAG: metallophosphoesterase, partial [Micromonosporaceae bacterium]|nr:metallophosphoesterase [Micromonosporaceae bacterium]